MTQENSADMQKLHQQHLTMPESEPASHRTAHARPSLAAPLVFLMAVGITILCLIYFGARDLVLPMLFLSLPLATLWLIVNDRQHRN